ncbi:MAG: TraR/DksA family transcriptional regulator [Bacteriovoracaceae bacterium]
MDKAMIEHFKNLFMEILSEEEIHEGAMLAPAVLEGDEVDIVSVEKENQMDFRLKARTAVYLKKVRKSLQKIEDGTFGECEDCGMEISYNRLMARPTADLCIHCKEAEEKEENQMVHKNRTSVKNGGRVLPIEHLEKGFNRDETSTSDFHVSHMDYQDIVS